MSPELSKGDRVICISMDDEYSAVPTGIPGTVTHVSVVFGEKQYNVNWDNGSKLALIEGVDKWIKEEDMLNRRKKRTEESFYVTKKDFLKENFYQQNIDLFRNFDVKLLQTYLKKLRETGVVNMMGASPYLWMGRERIEHKHHYDEFDGEREDVFQEVLDMADEVRNEMISGVMKILEKQNKEVSPRSVSRQIEEYARKMVIAYTALIGGRL
jgi:hypothetical protein